MPLVSYNRVDRRVWVLTARIHHGLVGVVLIIVGTVLVAHDRRDWHDWLRFST